MPFLLSVTFALGVLLIYLSLTDSRAESKAEPEISLADRWEAFVRQAGVEGVGAVDFLILSLGSGIAVGLISQLSLGWPVVSFVSFLIGLILPTWYLRARRDRRRAAMQEALADAVDTLRMAVRAGLSIEEGLASLARSGPEVLRPAFLDLNRELRLTGLDEAVRRTKERLADPVFDTVAAALLMSHKVGGRNMASVLEGLGRSVRQEVLVRREVRAQQAKNVLSARIIAALPLVLILGIRGMNPYYLDVFAEPAGQALLALCLLSVAVGYGVMLWTTRLPEDERVSRWRSA